MMTDKRIIVVLKGGMQIGENIKSKNSIKTGKTRAVFSSFKHILVGRKYCPTK